MRVYLKLVQPGNREIAPIIISKTCQSLSPLTNLNLSKLYQLMLDQLKDSPPQIFIRTVTNFQLTAVEYSAAKEGKVTMHHVRLPYLGNPLCLPPPRALEGEHIVTFLAHYEIIRPAPKT